MTWRDYTSFTYGMVPCDFDTKDELHFLAKLGTWHPARFESAGHTRPELLLKYKATLSLRHNWGSIDLKRVQEALADYLKESQSMHMPF